MDQAIPELLADNRVEELSSLPVILLTVSVQTSGKKRPILDLTHNLHVFKQKFKCERLHTIRDVFSKHYFVFSFDLSPGITMLTFFLSIAQVWLFPGTLTRV